MNHMINATVASMFLAVTVIACPSPCPPADPPTAEKSADPPATATDPVIDISLDLTFEKYADALRDRLEQGLDNGPYIYSPRLTTTPPLMPEDISRRMIEELLKRSLEDVQLEAPTQDIVLDVAPWTLGGPFDPDVTERGRNLTAYRDHYQALRVWLFEHHAGQWVVISGGQVFPRDGNDRIAPATTMDEAVRAATDAHPNARHRFVFRIGEEGDTSYHFTLSPYADVAGRQFLTLLSRHTIVAVDGLYLREVPLDEAGPSTRISGTRPDGVFASAAFRPPALDGDPIDRKAVMIDLHVATGFSGFATISADHASRLEAALWEIPGQINVEGWAPMRRARLHVSMDGTQLDRQIIVGIRPAS